MEPLGDMDRDLDLEYLLEYLGDREREREYREREGPALEADIYDQEDNKVKQINLIYLHT